MSSLSPALNTLPPTLRMLARVEIHLGHDTMLALWRQHRGRLYIPKRLPPEHPLKRACMTALEEFCLEHGGTTLYMATHKNAV